MKEDTNFKEKIKIDTSKSNTPKNDELIFERVYLSLLNYLRTLDFNSLLSNDNDLSLSKEELFKLEEEKLLKFVKIDRYIKFLSDSKYRTYLDRKIIPNRSVNSVLSNSSNNLVITEEKDIRLMYFIRELIHQYAIYEDHDIRDYYLKLCSALLLSYTNSHPLEETTIHFRFKSPKGLIEKLANNIIIKGTFEKDPTTGTEIFKFKETSDAFGAKVLSKKGFSPIASKDKDIKTLIREKNKEKAFVRRCQLFIEKINKLKNGEKIHITYRQYYKRCILLLKRFTKIISPQASEYINEINTIIIDFEKKLRQNNSKLSTPISDPSIFTIDGLNFEYFFKLYYERIQNPLSLYGLEKGINQILDNNSSTNLASAKDISQNIFDTIEVIKVEKKITSSGHEAIHYDIKTPYGIFELQLQIENQYLLDKKGPTSAHMLMDKKLILMPTPPKEYTSPDEINGEAIDIKLSDGTHIYLDKSEVSQYIAHIDLTTAKQGKISHNNVLNTIQLVLYESLKNLETLVTELPNTDPRFAQNKEQINYLRQKPTRVRKVIFHHIDPIIKYISSIDIDSFIRKFNQNVQTSDFTK